MKLSKDLRSFSLIDTKDNHFLQIKILNSKGIIALVDAYAREVICKKW